MKRLFILAGMLSLLIACGPKPVLPPSTVVEGCPQPPADVFTQVGVDATFAQSTYGKVVVGTIDVKTQPQVVTLLSQAVTDTRVKDYLRCLAIKRDKFTPEQAAYLEQLNSFVATKPTAEQFIQWQREHPFPGTSTGPNRIPERTGFLMPANESDPPSPCDVPKDATKIFLGSNVYWEQGRPMHVLAVDGLELLRMKETSNGLFIDAQISREDGRPVAKIVDNEFSVNPNQYFELKSRDRHELRVEGKSAETLLYVRFINEKTIWVEGTFYVKGHPPIRIAADHIAVGGVRLERNCATRIFPGSAFKLGDISVFGR